MSSTQSSPELRKQVLALAIPASLESVLQMSFGFVDQVVIGRLGEASLAAVGLTNQMVFLVTLVLGAVAASTAILVAQYHGKGDPVGVSRATGASFLIGAGVALPLALIPLLYPAAVLRRLGAEADVVAVGAPFIQWVALTVPMALLGTISVAVLRSLGDAKTPMLVTFFAVALNTVLNLVLVFGFGPFPALGVIGAAYATVITQALRLVILFYCMWARQSHVQFQVAHFVRFPTKLVMSIGRLTSPIALTEMFWALGSFLYTFMCIRLGTTAMAANQVVLATEAVFIMFSSGFSVAALTLIGQSIGAGDREQAKARARYIVKIGVFSSIVFGVALAIMTLQIEVFYPELPTEGLRLATLGLFIMAFFQPAKVLNMVMGNGVLRGGADNRFVLLADLVSIYAIGLPAAFYLAFGAEFGILGIFIGKVCEETSRVLMFIVRYRSDRWFHAVVEDSSSETDPSAAGGLAPEPGLG